MSKEPKPSLSGGWVCFLKISTDSWVISLKNCDCIWQLWPQNSLIRVLFKNRVLKHLSPTSHIIRPKCKGHKTSQFAWFLRALGTSNSNHGMFAYASTLLILNTFSWVKSTSAANFEWAYFIVLNIWTLVCCVYICESCSISAFLCSSADRFC